MSESSVSLEAISEESDRESEVFEDATQFANRMIDGRIRDGSKRAYGSAMNVIRRHTQELHPELIDEAGDIDTDAFIGAPQSILDVFGSISRKADGIESIMTQHF